jgi:TonB family protein
MADDAPPENQDSYEYKTRDVQVDIGVDKRAHLKITEVSFKHPNRILLSDGEEKYDGDLTPIYLPAPSYPSKLIKNKAGGKVTVAVKVGTDGYVNYIRIVSSSRDEFSYAVIDALKDWKFQPMTRKGEPTEFEIETSFQFRL